MYWNGKLCSLWGSTLSKICITLKKLQIKVDWNWISYKIVCECICLSLTQEERGGFKDQYVWNFIMYRNGKLDTLWGSMLPQIRISLKKSWFLFPFILFFPKKLSLVIRFYLPSFSMVTAFFKNYLLFFFIFQKIALICIFMAGRRSEVMHTHMDALLSHWPAGTLHTF